HVGAHVDVGVAADDNGASVHEVAGVASCVAIYPDETALHAPPVAAVGSSQVVACIALDDELAALHANAGKRVHAAFHEEFSSLHPGTSVHVGIVLYHHFTGGHLHADVLYSAD